MNNNKELRDIERSSKGEENICLSNLKGDEEESR